MEKRKVMKKKLFLGVFLAVVTITRIIQAADDSIILQSNDGKLLSLDGRFWRQSMTLSHLWEYTGLKNSAPDQRIVPIDKFSYADLEEVRVLLAVASKFPITPLPKNPTINDLQRYDQEITRAAQEFIKKHRYPDVSKHSKLFELADFFNIPVVMQAIAYNWVAKLIPAGEAISDVNLSVLKTELKKQIDQGDYHDPLTMQTIWQIENRIPVEHEKKVLLAKKNYFEVRNTQDPYFKGVSIQELIDRGRIPPVQKGFLSLNGEYIASLDGIENIPGLESINSLWLDYNWITTFPSNVKRLQNLTDLSLRDNRITTFPSKVEGLQHLDSLNLVDNRITTFPSKVEGLPNLTDLRLGGNRITTFPGKVEGLLNLKVLSLVDNQITVIPSSVEGLLNLTDLRLGGNLIVTLPSNIQGFQNLEDIYLSLQEPGFFDRLMGNTVPTREQMLQLQNNMNAARGQGQPQFTIKYRTSPNSSYEQLE